MYGDPAENNFIQLRQRSNENRDRYEQETMRRAEEQQRSGMWAPWAMSPVAQARQSLGNERAQANFNPAWDAWFQGVNEESDNQMGTFGSLVKGMRRAGGF